MLCEDMSSAFAEPSETTLSALVVEILFLSVLSVSSLDLRTLSDYPTYFLLSLCPLPSLLSSLSLLLSLFSKRQKDLINLKNSSLLYFALTR